MPRLPALLAIALGLGATVAACGTGASGVDACKSIEEARCRQVPNCPNVQISPPLYYNSGSDVDACIRYYDTACGHGVVIGSDPGTSQVNACVAAINSGSCDIVAAPETAPDCAWLEPPDAGDDGGGADATDATTTATDGDDSG
jgi:hypothetical protein